MSNYQIVVLRAIMGDWDGRKERWCGVEGLYDVKRVLSSRRFALPNHAAISPCLVEMGRQMC